MNTNNDPIAAPICRLARCAPRGAPWLQQRSERWRFGRLEPLTIRVWRPVRHGDGHFCAIELHPDSDGPRAVTAPTAMEALAAALARLAPFTGLMPLDDVALTHHRVVSCVAGIDVSVVGRAGAAQSFGDVEYPGFQVGWRAGEARSRRNGTPPLYALAHAVQCVVAEVRKHAPEAFPGVAVAVVELLSGGRRLEAAEVVGLGAPALRMLDVAVWSPRATADAFELLVRFVELDDTVYAFRAPSEAEAWLLAGRLVTELTCWTAARWLPVFWARMEACRAEVAQASADRDGDHDEEDERYEWGKGDESLATSVPAPRMRRPARRPDGPPLLDLPLPLGATMVRVRIWPSIAEDPAKPDDVCWAWWEAPPIHGGYTMGGLEDQGVLMALMVAGHWFHLSDVERAAADLRERGR